MLTRDVEGLLAAVDSFARAAGKSEQQAVPAAGEAPDDDVESVPLPDFDGGEDGISVDDIPEDPEEIKDLILSEVREQLGWDGTSGDPNASKDALEDALADMFDADVEIVWDGESQLILRVEGEDPIPLTVETLGELLEMLAKQGADDSDEDGEEDQAADEDEDGEDAADERGYEPDWQRSGILDEHKHLHAPKGLGGGRFVSKGGAGGGLLDKAKNVAAKTPAGKLAAGAAKLAPKTPAGKLAKSAAKVAAKTPAGKLAAHAVKLAPKTPAGKLVALARRRSGPRATAKAVRSALSASTGNRVRVSGNKDGTFNLGNGSKKQKVSAKKLSALTLASWVGGATAAGVLGVTLGPVAAGIAAGAAGAAVNVGAVLLLVKLIRSRKGKVKP